MNGFLKFFFIFWAVILAAGSLVIWWPMALILGALVLIPLVPYLIFQIINTTLKVIAWILARILEAPFKLFAKKKVATTSDSR